MIVALAEDSRVRKYDEAIFLGRSNASVVQMVERLFCTEDVWSSILHTGSKGDTMEPAEIVCLVWTILIWGLLALHIWGEIKAARYWDEVDKKIGLKGK